MQVNTRLRTVAPYFAAVALPVKNGDGFHVLLSPVYGDLNERLKGESIEDRIQRNWVIPLAAFRALEAVLDVPFTYLDLLNICVDGIIRQNRECKSNNELANF